MLKMVPKMLCRTRFDWRQLVAKFGSSTSTDLNSSCLCFPQRLHRCRWPLRSSGCNISVVPAQQEKHQTRTVTVKERFVRKENLHKKSESEFVKFESKNSDFTKFWKIGKRKKKQISQNTTLAYHILSPWPSQDSQNCGDSWQPQNTSLQSQSSHVITFEFLRSELEHFLIFPPLHHLLLFQAYGRCDPQIRRRAVPAPNKAWKSVRTHGHMSYRMCHTVWVIPYESYMFKSWTDAIWCILFAHKMTCKKSKMIRSPSLRRERSSQTGRFVLPTDICPELTPLTLDAVWKSHSSETQHYNIT